MQRFATFKDLDEQNVTIEEREEYEQHIAAGTVIYAGVDYEAILRQAWDLLPARCIRCRYLPSAHACC